ncbi:MAG: thiamine phosphate synthase [Planctomycetota bacterium]
MNTPERIIDANANRVRETLRVLEEAARFVVEDAGLSQQIKTIRHDFTAAMKPFSELIFHRNTPGDVGTTLKTDAEQTRASVKDIILAAGSRATEALRAIEEYAKLSSKKPAALQHLAQTAEQLRYRCYEVTKQLALRISYGNAPQWRLCLLLTQPLCTQHPWQEVLEQAIENGADCIQVREKQIDSGPLLTHIRRVIERVNGRATVIVNDRPDLARLSGAQGVHLGQTDINPLEAREIMGSEMIVGVSTSNLEQARQAKTCGADYCGVGPMFSTTTKHKPNLVGPDCLGKYLAWGGLPHLAIGGIHPNNVEELVGAGCRGVAVSSAICSAQDPGQVAKALARALEAPVISE